MAAKPSIPKGTRDFGPEQMGKRNFILQTIREVYQKYGFQPLETPAMENLSVLTGKYGDEGDTLLFKILNSGDFLSDTSEADYKAGYKTVLPKVAKKGLRYDLTVPFARYVVMNQSEISFPFKRYQIQPVWRADRPQKGRYQEFYQCDADVVGTDSLICEAEIVAMMEEVLQKLALQNFVIKINNRKVLAGMAEAIGASGKEGALCVAIDKLDKIGLDQVKKELLERDFSESAVAQLEPMLFVSGNNEERLQGMKALLGASEIGKKGIEELEETFRLMRVAGISYSHVEIDFTLARGLAYYTGAIFEVKVLGSGIGSISGGGRYDDLTGVFGLPGVSGVGFSFGVDRVYDVMEEQQVFPADSLQSTQVLFINFDQTTQDYCLPLLQQLRAANIKAEIFPHKAKIGKQMTYANNKRIPYVVLAGSEEMQQGKLTLKEMESGAQSLISPQELVEKMLGR
jgi:histidyl-tRNA synthetase